MNTEHAKMVLKGLVGAAHDLSRKADVEAVARGPIQLLTFSARKEGQAKLGPITADSIIMVQLLVDEERRYVTLSDPAPVLVLIEAIRAEIASQHAESRERFARLTAPLAQVNIDDIRPDQP